MKFKYLLLIVAAFVAVSASAQMKKTVQWRLTVKMTNATEGVATLKAIIDPGWHLYGTEAVKDGPQPTLIDFKQSTGVKLNGKFTATTTPIHKYDQLFETNLSWWENTATFKQKFKVTNNNNAEIKCTVRYTTCNNVNCSMPVTENLSKKIAK